MLSEITTEELAAAIDVCASRVLESHHIDRPPVDAMTLARGLGMSIALDREQPERGRIVRHSAPSFGSGSRGSGHSILLRPEPRLERRQWAIAHEIGEAHAHLVFSQLGIDPRTAPVAAREEIASQIANRLLLPTAWFASDARACDWDLFKLKQRYVTASHELIARRMLDFEPPIVVTVFDQGQPTYRRTNGLSRCDPLMKIEKTCWEVAHRMAQPYQMAERGLTVCAWPIHEPDWKREILRLELPEEDSYEQ